MVLARELGEFLDDDRARRHVDAERQRLRREHDLEQARGEGFFDRFLHWRHHPRVVRRHPGLEPREPHVVAQGLEVGVREVFQVRIRDAPQRDPVGGVREPDPAREALLDGLVAARAREHEHDRGQHLLVGQPLYDLGAPGLVEPGAPGSVRTRGSAAFEAGHDRIGP